MKTYKTKQIAAKKAYAELRDANSDMDNDELRELFTIEQHDNGQYFWRRVQSDINARVGEYPAEIIQSHGLTQIDEVPKIDKKGVLAMRAFIERIGDDGVKDVVLQYADHNAGESDQSIIEYLCDTIMYDNPENSSIVEYLKTMLSAPEVIVADECVNVNNNLNKAPIVDYEKIANNTTSDGILRKSAIDSPCRFVWTLAEQMHVEGATRKQVIDACVEQGVATHTAKTQYQKWFRAFKNSQQQ